MRNRLIAILIVLIFTSPAHSRNWAADFNSSGDVDFDDFLLFAESFGTENASCDLDGSGIVDFTDFLVFAEAFSWSPPDPIADLTPVSVVDLPADPNRTGIPTFYSLLKNHAISPGDSTTTNWDLAFSGTSVILNGRTSGSGNAGAIVLTGVDFDTLSVAPEAGYDQDFDAGGSLTGWYTYTGPFGRPPHAILMNDSTAIVVRTAEGRYAKIKFTSYYKGGAAVPGNDDESRFYNFTYVIQPDVSSRELIDSGPKVYFESRISDLPADTASTGVPTFFSLRTGRIIAPEDSATTKWDLAFRSTSVITNGGTGGTGNGGAMVLTATDFDTLSTAPETGYEVESDTSSPISGWYTYTGPVGFPPHSILMNPGVVVIVKTADEKFAKVQFLSYYRGGSPVPNEGDSPRFYHFKYGLQPDGSRGFSK